MVVIEDAACSLGGSTSSGQPSGTVGDFGCFSLHPRKVVTCGEGGLVAVASGQAAVLRSMRDYGRTRAGFGDVFEHLGLNLRMSDIAAAVARVQVGRVVEAIGLRGRLVALYLEALAGVPGVRVPAGYRRPGQAFQSMVVRVPDGAAAVEALADKGVQAGVAAHCLTRQSFFVRRFADAPACPVSEALALPLFEEMTEADVARVADALASGVGSSRMESNV